MEGVPVAGVAAAAAPEAAALVAVFGPEDGAVLPPTEAHLLHHCSGKNNELVQVGCLGSTYSTLLPGYCGTRQQCR